MDHAPTIDVRSNWDKMQGGQQCARGNMHSTLEQAQQHSIQFIKSNNMTNVATHQYSKALNYP